MRVYLGTLTLELAAFLVVAEASRISCAVLSNNTLPANFCALVSRKLVNPVAFLSAAFVLASSALLTNSSSSCSVRSGAISTDSSLLQVANTFKVGSPVIGCFPGTMSDTESHCSSRPT